MFSNWKKVHDWEHGTGTGQGSRMLDECAEEDRVGMVRDITGKSNSLLTVLMRHDHSLG